MIGERLSAVRLRDACMVGPVDLETIALLCPLLLKDFYFDQTINLNKLTVLSRVFACVATGRSTSGGHHRTVAWITRPDPPGAPCSTSSVVRRHPEPPHHRFGPCDRLTCPRGPASQNIVIRRRSFCVGRYSKPTVSRVGFDDAGSVASRIMVKKLLSWVSS